MKALLIFVTILAVVSSRNIPKTNYVPTQQQLELIFGSTPPIQTKPIAVGTPALVPNESAFIEKHIKPYQKATSNVIFPSETPKKVELNIKIKVNDCDKKGGSIDKTTDDGTKKQIPEKGNPDIHTRFVEDDRVSLEVDNCPTDRVRFAGKCVPPD